MFLILGFSWRHWGRKLWVNFQCHVSVNVTTCYLLCDLDVLPAVSLSFLGGKYKIHIISPTVVTCDILPLLGLKNKPGK